MSFYHDDGVWDGDIWDGDDDEDQDRDDFDRGVARWGDWRDDNIWPECKACGERLNEEDYETDFCPECAGKYGSTWEELAGTIPIGADEDYLLGK